MVGVTQYNNNHYGNLEIGKLIKQEILWKNVFVKVNS